MNVKIYVFIIALAVLVASVLPLPSFHPTAPASTKKLAIERKLHITPLLSIEVYRHGRLVKRHVQVDPPTSNFRKLLYVIFNPVHDSSTKVIDLNGASIYLEKKDHYSYSFCDLGDLQPRFYIRIGNYSQPFSREIYNLGCEIGVAEAGDASLAFNTTHIILTLSGSWSADDSYNITEVGLSMIIDKGGANYNNDIGEILIFYTPLSTPISVVINDTIVVTYEFIFNEPYVINMGKFFRMVFSKYAGDSSLVSVNDTNGNTITIKICDDGSRSFFDFNDYMVGIVIGNGTEGWSINRFKLDHEIARSITPSVNVIQTDSATIVTFTASFGFNKTYNITEIGLILRGEQNTGDNNDLAEILVAYFALNMPIHVEAGEILVITIKLEFP